MDADSVHIVLCLIECGRLCSSCCEEATDNRKASSFFFPLVKSVRERNTAEMNAHQHC